MKKLETALLISVSIFYQIVQVLSAVSSCRAKLTDSTNTITSPDYPGIPKISKNTESSNFINCIWEIEVPKGKGIQLKFGHFDMGAPNDPDDCDKGNIQILSGIGKQKKFLDKYCPGNDPPTVSLVTNTATVIFRRPYTFSGTGFLISYIAITPYKLITDLITCAELGQINVDMERYSVTCPGGCGNITSDYVYGGLPYRDDNTHLCRAAIHAGVISDKFGGKVNVTKTHGVLLYVGDVANNITGTTASMGTYTIDFPASKVCRENIVLQSQQFSASSSANTTEKGRLVWWTPEKARMDSLLYAWAPAISDNPQWLQVDIGKAMQITEIHTRGSEKPYSYTRAYKVRYSENGITWNYYKHFGDKKPKVFSGNSNFHANVRNNFIDPPIFAKYLRIYPICQSNEKPVFCGLKMGLSGCDIKETSTKTIVTTEPFSILPVKSTASSTTTSSTVATVKFISTTSIINMASTKYQRNLTGTNISIIKETPKKIPVDVSVVTSPKIESDMNSRSIVIIAIVAALAVTSILLSALVLFLVRKRKKDPNQQTTVPKGNSQSNALYNASLHMSALGHNNNDKKKKSRKSEKKNGSPNLDFLNTNYRETLISLDNQSENSFLNSRGGVTLRYDNRLDDGEHISRKRSSLPTSASYSTSNDPGISSEFGNMVYGEETANLLAGAFEHEYHVILDPVREGEDVDGQLSSKFSLAFNGNNWGKDLTREKRTMSSFAPLPSNKLSRAKRPGTFPHQQHYVSRGEGQETFFSPPTNASSQLTTIQTSASTKDSDSRHRLSSSSGNSSLPSHQEPSIPLLPPKNLPASDKGLAENLYSLDQLHMSAKQNQRDRRGSYQVPPNNSPMVSSHLLSPPGAIPSSETNFMSTFSSEKPEEIGLKQNSRSESFNQAKLRNGYDHLYKGNTIGTHCKSNNMVGITTNDYDKLKLNLVQ